MTKMKGKTPRLHIQRLLFGATVGITMLVGLHISSYVTSGEKRATPQWLRDNPRKACLPRSNIGFLKSHKCASSAFQNILFRYGLDHGLNFALPDVGNYFGGGTNSFNSGMLLSSPLNQLPINIFAIHTKWNHRQIQLVMPNDTVYVTAVRDPVELFESLYIYTNMKLTYKMSLEEYALKKAPDVARYRGYIGYNQMVWDFGMPEEHMNNLTAVEEMVKEADEQFDLVMVAERMEESLVLLAHLLCWDLEDVLVLKINARNEKFKKDLESEGREILRKRLAPDYVLYNHFAKKFDDLVAHFGRDRMAKEVARLRQLTQELMEECKFVRKEAERISGPEKPSCHMVDGYKGTPHDTRCAHYSRSELPFINFLRAHQRSKIFKRNGVQLLPGLDAIPLGPELLQNTHNVTGNIDLLKKMLIHKEKND